MGSSQPTEIYVLGPPAAVEDAIRWISHGDRYDMARWYGCAGGAVLDDQHGYPRHSRDEILAYAAEHGLTVWGWHDHGPLGGEMPSLDGPVYRVDVAGADGDPAEVDVRVWIGRYAVECTACLRAAALSGTRITYQTQCAHDQGGE